jgi:hypothetical protein
MLYILPPPSPANPPSPWDLIVNYHRNESGENAREESTGEPQKLLKSSKYMIFENFQNHKVEKDCKIIKIKINKVRISFF